MGVETLRSQEKREFQGVQMNNQVTAAKGQGKRTQKKPLHFTVP